jgi:cobyrinic acid a,c-diamide synthase
MTRRPPAGRAAPLPRLYVSAAHRSSGKTTISLGLAAALRARGLAVQAFKKGPDYIDPMWLAAASGRDCFNLDPQLMPMAGVRDFFARRAAGADVAIVEGNHGLHDGMALDGSDSNAALAVALGAPVVLVLDARGMTRGIAPLLLGLRDFDPRVRVGGVILNRVGGARHEARLREVIEHYTAIPVLGALGESADAGMTERHLGLVPVNEDGEARERIARICAVVGAAVDLDRVLDLAASAPAMARPRATGALGTIARAARSGVDPVRIGVAMDRAFGFYYADDLEELRRAGARLLAFDTLRDRALPCVDALLIGGGFPESCAAELEANTTMRRAIAGAVRAGIPVHAECGGLMYLSRSLTVRGRRFEMVGAIEGDVHMHRRPVGKGYVELESTGDAPWAAPGAAAGRVRAHEFHYSSLEGLPADTRFAWKMVRGHGVDGAHDGIIVNNLLASYSHLRSLAGSSWAPDFVRFCAGRIAASGGEGTC